jgi:hypothetical protein
MLLIAATVKQEVRRSGETLFVEFVGQMLIGSDAADSTTRPIPPDLLAS